MTVYVQVPEQRYLHNLFKNFLEKIQDKGCVFRLMIPKGRVSDQFRTHYLALNRR